MKTNKRGQALTEFALILPILLLLLLGIIEGARVIWAYITVQNAAREAVRFAVSGQPLNSQGDPWTMTPEDRSDPIKGVAAWRAMTLDETSVFSATYVDYTDNITTPGAIAVALWGQKGSTDTCADPDPINADWCRDYAGREGLNVKVAVYYNVAMLDPIYAAIVRDGYVHVYGETLMQNEGLDSALGGQPPGGFTGSSGSPGSSNPPSADPALTIQGGTDWTAGDTIYIQLSFHNASTTYHIYSDVPNGCSSPCFIGIVTTDVNGLGILSYTIPVDTPEGSYVFESRPASNPSTVTADTSINVSASTTPVILTYGDRWPVGSPLQIGLASHAPTTAYSINWGPNPNPSAVIGSITTDGDGNAPVGSLIHIIGTSGSFAGPGTYLVSSGLATRTIEVLPGCIKVNQGICGQVITVPAGALIKILLQSHAPSRIYEVQFDGTPIPASPVTTSLQGEAFMQFTIPGTTANGTYTIRSLDGGQQIATVDIIVDTPTTPFIYVAGGNTWPAGSSIDYQLRNHLPNTLYDIYWEGTQIVNATQTDANGEQWLNFTIPVSTTPATTYTLSSRLDADNSLVAESDDITVTAEPYLVIVEGNPQLPGNTITIELRNHEVNASYDVYVGGVPIPNGTVTTDSSGFASLQYTIPDDLASGDYLIESRQGVNVIASTTLQLIVPDLAVQNIEVPVNPTFNQDIPITVTIVNSSSVVISHRSFDVDIYLDPVQTPDLGTSLPPGDYKIWIQPPLGAGEARTFQTTIPLYGAFDHRVWARADTSGRIVESDETNNLDSALISPGTCSVEYDVGNVSWSSIGYGDAEPSASELGSSIILTSTGYSTWADHNQSDNDTNRGLYYIYQTQSGNFEVQVRLVDVRLNTSKFGIEIRESTAGDSPKVDWGRHTDNTLQHRWRTTSSSGGGSSTGWVGLSRWMRVVRTGNTFRLYQANTGGSRPAAGDWVLEETDTVPMSSSVLVGLFNSSYDYDDNGVVEFDNYRVCVANSNCSAGNILYEPTYDGSMDAAWNEIGFGDVTLPSYSVGSNSVTITSGGDSLATSSNNDVPGSGHYYVYHTISDDFDVRVRAASRSNLMYNNGSTSSGLAGWAAFGISLRADLDPTADRLGIYRTYGQGVRVHRRVSGNSNTWEEGQDDQPVWLRVVRSGDNFTFYYAYTSNNPPADTDWVEHRNLTVASMPNTLYIGLANASDEYNAMTQVQFTDYHICGDPGGAESCGEVREAAGLVVINAVNYTDNIPRSGQEWEETSRSGKAGMVVPNEWDSYGSNFQTTAPELQYEVDFTTMGTYYVWILGSRPDNSGNSFYLGMDDIPGTGFDYMDSNESNNTVAWFDTTSPTGGATFNVTSPGSRTINVWTREDGFEIYQILLTTDSAYDPSTLSDPLGVPQSQCSAVGSIPTPPGLQQCSQMIQNGRFEDDALISLWHYAGIDEQVTRTSVPHYLYPGESFSMLLPAESVAGIPRHPWLYQEFVMPSWVITPVVVGQSVTGGTSAGLTLHKGVNHLDATPDPDPLYAILRNQSGSLELTSRITVATGIDTPRLDPTTGYDNSDWVQVTTEMMDDMVAAGYNPVDYAGQTMQLYIFSPNPTDTYNTRFYVDNVELNICTSEPLPTSYSTLVRGNVRVFLNGVPTPKPGVRVWTYAIDGSMQTTYTIQDSSYSFYDLPADPGGTQYILYAEYWDEDSNLYTAASIIVLRAGQTLTNIDLLLF